MTEGWLDASGQWIEPDELGPLDEVLARLRALHTGDLQAFLLPPARWEQGLEPVILHPEDEHLARELLELPADRSIVDEALRDVGAERARALLRQVVAEWDVPQQVQHEVRPYLQRRHGEVTWLLETVGVGVTAVQIQISVAGPLPDELPYHLFHPRADPEGKRSLEPWWSEFEADPLRLSDDLGTCRRIRGSEVAWGFPLRVVVDGRSQARVAERYSFVFVPGLPLTARSLTLSGTINLVLEQPFTQSPPWPTKELSLGDFSYTIDLQGWWPEVAREWEDEAE